MFDSGRIYQNPRNRRQIWINVGWHHTGFQRYPGWDLRLSKHFSRQAFFQIINEVREEFRNPPCSTCGSNFELLQIADIACLYTAGVCFCPWVIKKCIVKNFSSRVDRTLELVGSRLGLNVSYHYITSASYRGWKDINGNGTGHGFGPPLGCNIIITLPNAIQWPPRNTAAAALPVTRPLTASTPLAATPLNGTRPQTHTDKGNSRGNISGGPRYRKTEGLTASAPPPEYVESVPPPAYDESAPPAFR